MMLNVVMTRLLLLEGGRQLGQLLPQHRISLKFALALPRERRVLTRQLPAKLGRLFEDVELGSLFDVAQLGHGVLELIKVVAKVDSSLTLHRVVKVTNLSALLLGVHRLAAVNRRRRVGQRDRRLEKSSPFDLRLRHHGVVIVLGGRRVAASLHGARTVRVLHGASSLRSRALLLILALPRLKLHPKLKLDVLLLLMLVVNGAFLLPNGVHGLRDGRRPGFVLSVVIVVVATFVWRQQVARRTGNRRRQIRRRREVAVVVAHVTIEARIRGRRRG